MRIGHNVCWPECHCSLERNSFLCILAAALAAFSGCGKKEAQQAPPPPEVEVFDVVQQDVPIYQEWVAQLTGPVNADITPKVQGYLEKQNYQNGAFVKQGQLLFELDPRQYEANVDKAKAELARTEANIARFQTNVARDTPLAAQKAIPQKDLDEDIANLDAVQAQKRADEAALQNARLDLGWTKINSPISGIAGNASSQIGDLVGTTTKMTTVSQVEPIWANFSVSEATYLDKAAAISKYIRGLSRVRVPLQYIQANGENYAPAGRVIALNRQVAAGTGTLQFTAEFPNPNGVLRPGGFGRVRLQTGDNKNALVVPQAAVIEVQSQYQLIVVSPDNKAKFRSVKMGDKVGSNWIVTEGLQPGERIVVEGLTKVQQAAAASPKSAQDGIPVTPKPYEAVATTAGNR